MTTELQAPNAEQRTRRNIMKMGSHFGSCGVGDRSFGSCIPLKPLIPLKPVVPLKPPRPPQAIIVS